MGFLGDLKKLFFAQKSVAKSAANKAKEQGEEWIDEAKEHGEELFEKARDKGGEFYESAKSKSEELLDQAKQKGNEWKDKAEDKLDDLMDSFDAKDETATEVTKSTIPAAPGQSIPRSKSFVEELSDKVEKLSDKAMDGFESATEKAKDLSEDLGEKIHDAKDVLVEKSKQAADYLDQKLDETVEKAKKLDAEIEAEANDRDKDGFADTPVDISSSELRDKDDFFSKAEAYAEGRPMDGSDEVKITQTETKGPEYKTYGFEDRDGDGDELIDDAIVEEE